MNGPTAPPSVAVLAREEPRTVELPPSLTVKELADLLGLGAPQVIKALMDNGVLATINQTLDYDTAAIVADHLGFTVVEAKPPVVEEVPSAEGAGPSPEEQAQLQPRPPVVTVMGHVDHGKTSLLDAIRQTNVAAGESGGITQHIGAYQVEVDGKRITFLDTPGHEAFTAMRARGAQLTDIAVLVVAADDGVMPQTKEAAAHAQAAKVAIIVALNKIDKPDANPERVKGQLAEIGLVPVEYGGDIEVVEVSAKRRIGIDKLLETILIVAELLDLKANPSKPATGTVVEAKLDRARGPVATVLVQNGTLKPGDIVVAGSVMGKVKALFNDKGKKVKKAEPATPVEVLGLSAVPAAGDRLVVVPDEKTARALADQARRAAEREAAAEARRELSLSELLEKMAGSQVKELNVVVKTDVQGSLEPILSSLHGLEQETGLRIKVLHAGTGNITESDVLLASAAAGVVVGFNVRPEPGARNLAEARGVDIRLYSVIYNLIDDIRKALEGLLEPQYQEVVNAHAEVRAVFKVGRNQAAAGCYVTDGTITRGSLARVLRRGAKVHEGRIDTLRRFKEDVREVAAGYECGIMISGFSDWQPGDIIETYSKERVA